jgi:hypothetical protein
MRLLSSQGELIKGRCKATNLCAYCQRLYVRETVEALILDALDGDAPEFWLVLTAREHLTRAGLSAVLRHLRRVLRRRWPSIEWFVQVEMQRRGALHANLLIKGAPVADGDELLRLAADEWCSRVDALPVAQWLGAVGASEVVARYLGKMLGHGLKQEQAPPIGWKGHRTSQTRGYFPQGAAVIRRRARESLAGKRAVAVALASGLGAHDAELAAQESMRLAAATTWVLANDSGARMSDHGNHPKRRVLESLRAAAESRPVAAFDRAWLMRRLALVDRWAEARPRTFALTDVLASKSDATSTILSGVASRPGAPPNAPEDRGSEVPARSSA